MPSTLGSNVTDQSSPFVHPDAQTVETHLYLKVTSFCVNILIVLFMILILIQ